MIKKILFLFLFIPAVCFSAPSITSVTGDLDHGQTGITIAGSGFGTHPLSIEWLGGADGNIEEGVNDAIFAKSKWYVPGDSTTNRAVRYSTTMAKSGSKSIMSAWPLESQYDSTFTYDHGSTFTTIYVTFWYYFDHVDSSGEWKAWWLRHNTQIKNAYNTIFFSRLGGGMVIPMCTDSTWTTCHPDTNYSLRYWGIYPPQDTWVRIEIYAEDSDPNVMNGTLIVKRNVSGSTFGDMLPADSLGQKEWNGTVLNRTTTGNDWRCFQFTGYWGNITVGDGTNEKLYYDDIYIQPGTRARVEIGNNATFANCTKREIQYPTSWSTSSIQFTCNHGGSFSQDETAYVFVVDSDGAVNETGEEITIGGTGGGDTTPAIISGASPSGAQTCTIDPRPVTISCVTNENATIKYGLSGEDDLDTPASPVDADTSYDLLPHTFSTTGELSHSTVVSNACDAAYTYYVRSMDAAGNKNTSSTTISYTVSAEEVDTIDPTISISYPETDPFDQQTQYITVSGIASDDQGLSSVSASCPLCQSVSAVTGTTEWSVDLVLSQGTLGSDLLFGEGVFSATGNWSVGTYWSIAEGVATNDGTGANSWLSYDAAVEVGETYRLYYDVTAYTSGNLYISQYGFGGSTVQLSNEIGSHTLDVTCTQDAVLGIVSNYWIGSIDNVMLKKNQRNLLTMTATDSSANTNTDTVEIGYTPPSTTPTRVLGVGSYYNIDLGGGVILEIQ